MKRRFLDVEDFKKMVASQSTSQSAGGQSKRGVSQGSRNGRNKFRAESEVRNGRRFDSKHEASAVERLQLLQLRGDIFNLRLQVPFDLVVNDVLIARYVADAVFTTDAPVELLTLDGVLRVQTGQTVVVDAKSKVTRKLESYRMKKKLMLALKGMEVVEV